MSALRDVVFARRCCRLHCPLIKMTPVSSQSWRHHDAVCVTKMLRAQAHAASVIYCLNIVPFASWLPACAIMVMRMTMMITMMMMRMTMIITMMMLLASL